MKKILGAKRAKIGPEIRFFAIFSYVWFIIIPLNCIDDSVEQRLTTSNSKTHEKNLGDPELGPKLGF